MNKKKVLFYLPFIIYAIFMCYMIIQIKINIPFVLLTACLLLLTAVGFSSNNKYSKLLGFISLFAFTIWYGINGYYDYIKWASSVVGFVVFLYFVIVYFAIKLIDRKNKKKV